MTAKKSYTSDKLIFERTPPITTRTIDSLLSSPHRSFPNKKSSRVILLPSPHLVNFHLHLKSASSTSFLHRFCISNFVFVQSITAERKIMNSKSSTSYKLLLMNDREKMESKLLSITNINGQDQVDTGKSEYPTLDS